MKSRINIWTLLGRTEATPKNVITKIDWREHEGEHLSLIESKLVCENSII